MDINYLLLLQNLREATNNFFSPFFIWFTDFSVGFWPLAMVAMIYWVFDKSAGKKILAGFSFGILMNGFLKLTFKITRPWLRDDRILPYGNSKITATGYSFPSGHTTFATSLLGGTAMWQKNRNRCLAIILLLMMIIIMFSRNYLGVHTPQDVLVGMLSTILMMFIANKLEDWTDKDPKRDLMVIGGGLFLCALLFVYYTFFVHIEKLYDVAGTLIVDPPKMKGDSFEGIGAISSFVICRYFARRHFDYESAMDQKSRFIVCTILLIPFYLWYSDCREIICQYNRALGRFLTHSGMIAYVLIIVPFILTKIKLPRWMQNS